MRFFSSVPETKKIKLIVGLGNPGAAYKKTRHNAGALAVEKLAGKNRFLFKRNRSFKSLIASGKIQGESACLALPQTFMNLSGEAVALLMRKKRILPEDILVVCDDAALPLGTFKVKAGGSDGGHNGLASIIEKLGTKDFPRLRLGIGGTQGDLSDYVLSSFKKDEEPVMREALDKSVEIMETWLAQGIDTCMNRFNRKK